MNKNFDKYRQHSYLLTVTQRCTSVTKPLELQSTSHGQTVSQSDIGETQSLHTINRLCTKMIT